MTKFDVIVVGGGHAGCEAAFAAVRRGCSVALIAIDTAAIGFMSCNPAIGGVGKGHIVREIDAFGGLMAEAADDAAIHYRMLNRSKGVAVHGPRVQADRDLYRASIQGRLNAAGGLTILQGEVVDLDIMRDAVVGVELADGSHIAGSALVLATGTFLGGRLFRGEERLDGGRLGERGAHRLAVRLSRLGLATARLKTGTPPRLAAASIDWARLGRQDSDTDDWLFSSATRSPRRNPQLFCGVTRTTTRTHDVIRRSLSRSPLYSGAIAGRGPRYCPSIEDKVARFGDRDGHQIFLEPETLAGGLVYPNGISTSLPTDVQQDLVATIPGLERAAIVVPGYAVEYTHIDARCMAPTLNVSHIPGLYLAGQIAGTTGYEEAAGQGLIAGLNAAAHARGLDPIVIERHEGYIGVMIDDLTLCGTSEPYRMLTARAEFRLSLRADNAEARLAAKIDKAAVLSERRRAAFDRRQRQRQGGDNGAAVEPLDDAIQSERAADALYAPYVARQQKEVERRGRLDMPIGREFRYGTVAGLSSEMVERLDAARPSTIEQAGRVPGVTPAAVTALMIALHRHAA